ncbi:hypothetical protein, partial [Roseivivax sp. CAU 1761]
LAQRLQHRPSTFRAGNALARRVQISAQLQPGCPVKWGALHIETHPGIDADYSEMYVASVQQSYPNTRPVAMLLDIEDDPLMRM